MEAALAIDDDGAGPVVTARLSVGCSSDWPSALARYRDG
jgi:hypothetical protein